MKLLNHEFVGSTIHYYFENGIELVVEDWGSGTKWWYQNGKHHRLDGPAIEYSNGDKFWFQNGKRHRLDGPAYEWSNDSKEWYQNDKLHRLDGPAIEWADGHKYWYIEGKHYSEQDFNQMVKNRPA